MKRLTFADAISHVRNSIDELKINDSLFESDSDSQDLDTIIVSKLKEAIIQAYRTCSLTKIGGDCSSAQAEDFSQGPSAKVVRIKVPGFLRLVGIKAKDSDVIVTDWYTPDSMTAKKQVSPWNRGTYERPIAVIGVSSADRELLYYSLKDDAQSDLSAKFDYVHYLSEPDIVPENDYVDISEGCEMAILTILTALVLMVYKDPHAESFTKLAEAYL